MNYKDLQYRLRCHTKRTDLPADVLRDIGEAYAEIERLRKERDEARRMWCEAAPVGNCLSVDDMNQRARAEAKRRGWDCYKDNTND